METLLYTQTASTEPTSGASDAQAFADLLAKAGICQGMDLGQKMAALNYATGRSGNESVLDCEEVVLIHASLYGEAVQLAEERETKIKEAQKKLYDLAIAAMRS